MAMASANRGPRLPVPPPLCSDVPGTWAFDTMSDRVRTDILARVFRENDFSPATLSRLQILDRELADAATTLLTPLEEDGGKDVSHWNGVILKDALASRATWLSAPWALAEFYFYRRIMTAVDYFREPVDPFSTQKKLGLSSSSASMQTLAVRLNDALGAKTADHVPDLLRFILTALWGNRMDLSIWPVGSRHSQDEDQKQEDSFTSVIAAGQQFILADHSDQLANHVMSLGMGKRYDIIVDNAGFELFCDLCLADFLVSSGLATNVYLHLKSHPTFVSDAMEKDVGEIIDFMKRSDSTQGLLAAGSRWSGHVVSGAWVLVEDDFWVQPSAMWLMSDTLYNELQNSSLVFVKGDANYRRLLGDCKWKLDTPFKDIVSYFPAPVCALRTLKAEIGCGLPPKDVTDEIATNDPTWMVSGKYGVVQFLTPDENE